MATVSFKQVCKRYPKSDTLVVNNLDLEIADNEFLVLVGPSGCGKSTTLRMIAGLEDVTSGDVYIGDAKVTDLQPRERDISMVFQNYALYPHLDVRGNLAFGLKMQKKPKEEVETKVNEISDMLELTELINRKPSEMSGGQRQRVAMGRAIVRDTKVMLMDEPLSNLDAKLRVQMRSEILKLHKRIQRTVVYVTHDQVEAMTMGDRIAVMHDGIMQQIDKPSVVYNNPANMFVAGFMGSPPMNFMKCTIEKQGEELVAKTHDFSIALPAALAEKAAAYVGKKLILGARPEHVACEEEGKLPGNTFDAVADVIEVLGSEELINITVNSEDFTVRTKKNARLKEGNTLSFRLNPNKLCLFDPETEKNIMN